MSSDSQILTCDWLNGLTDTCCALGHLQDSTGMKMWKKRWFVLSDMCLFYYRGESVSPVYVHIKKVTCR